MPIGVFSTTIFEQLEMGNQKDDSQEPFLNTLKRLFSLMLTNPEQTHSFQQVFILLILPRLVSFNLPIKKI